MKSIVEQIFAFGKRHLDKEALLDGKTKFTYAQLLEGIVRAKDMLENKYGLKESDRVILAADKQLEFVFIYFACHLLGAIVFPIAPDTNWKRYSLIKQKANPSLVVGFKDKEGKCKTAGFEDFAGDGCKPDTGAIVFPDMENIADILFTTGTTGEPKGVQLSQKNIAAAALNINTFVGNTSNDVEMLALPISHSFGLGRMRCALSNGQTLVMLGSFANVKRFFRFMGDYHVTGFGMVPASWGLLKKLSGMEIAKYSHQLRYIEIGSAPMPIEEKKALMKALPDTRICMHYGLTEASRSAFMEFHEDREHLFTVGRQSPNMRVSIRDEKGREVSDGEEGEICVEGEAVTIGYLGIPKSEAFWEHSFRTGDWGYVDGEGYIFLKSRKKELINVGGKKVSPIEVEEILKKINFIDDCVCIAHPDPEGILGEVIKAFIVSGQPEKVEFDAIDRLIGNQLEGFKHPALYEVIDEIPKTSSGKVQRLLLK